MKTRLVVDSRARESGTVGNFWIELRPTLERIRKVSLVWADIPTPLQTPGGPYFLIRVLELGTRMRVIGSTVTQGTTTTAGFRRRGLIGDAVQGFFDAGVAAANFIADQTTDGGGYTLDPITTEDPVAPTQPGPVFNTRCGLETTFLVPVTVNVDERAFYSPETSFNQTLEYNPPIEIHRLTIEITRNYDATQITGDSVLVFEVEHD